MMETILSIITAIRDLFSSLFKKLRFCHGFFKNVSFKLIFLSLIAALILFCVGFFGHASSQNDTEEMIIKIDAPSSDEMEEIKREEALDRFLLEFKNFGIVDTEGYINLRSEPDELHLENIIGRLDDGAGVDILNEEGEWLYVSSGNLKGYCLSEYILTGDSARKKAQDFICDRVIVTTDMGLNIRSEPNSMSQDNIIGRAREGERYVLVGVEGEWAKIEDATAFIGTNPDSDVATTEGYVNFGDGNARIHKCLNVAKNLDLRMMATTQYDNPILCVADGYVNIRNEMKARGIENIIGKFTNGNGGELLETDYNEEDGSKWYKIRSGDVTGYVSADHDYFYTGENAKNYAVSYAKLTAYVNVDALKVRSSPVLDETDANVWTKITKNQAYDVIDQLDGWVEIALDSGDEEEDNPDQAFISTRDNNVIVRYGLEEAVEYFPAVEAANQAAAFRNSIVNFAMRYLGGKYVWGGTNLNTGVDCSGFVMRVFQNFGINLPRTSRNQAQSGTRVTSDVMKPGDLVFYANRSGTINHVAIYIGNGQVICAASRRSGVKIYRWNYRTPVAIRNVIGA